MCLAGFTGDGTSCAVFLSVVCRPEMLAIMASLDQKDSYVLTGDGTSCTVFLSVVCRPEMLGIMASLDQKDSYVLGWFYW